MRLRLLGSAAGKTVPRSFCRCRVCALAKERGGANRRTRTGLQIFLDGEGGNEAFCHVDLPPDTGHHMVRDGFCLAHLAHLLLTHGDEDHFDPIYLRNRKIILSDRAELIPLTIHGSRTLGERIAGLGLDFGYLKLSFNELRPFQNTQVGELQVLPLAATHTPDTLNYVIHHRGRTVLLAWDTGYWPEKTWHALAGQQLDAVFLECTTIGPQEAATRAHLDFATFLRMRQRLLELDSIEPATPFIAVHIGDNGGLTHEEAVAFAAPYGVTVGYDGLELHL